MIFQPTFWHCLCCEISESALSNKRRSVLFNICTHGSFYLTREEAFYLIYAHTVVFLPDLKICDYQKSPFSVDRNVMVNFKLGEYMRKIFFCGQ